MLQKHSSISLRLCDHVMDVGLCIVDGFKKGNMWASLHSAVRIDNGVDIDRVAVTVPRSSVQQNEMQIEIHYIVLGMAKDLMISLRCH